MKANWNIRELLREMDALISDPVDRGFMFDGHKAKILGAIQSVNESQIRIAMGRVGQLSTWFGRVGAVKVLKGDPLGWRDLRLSANCKYWSIRFFSHLFHIDDRANKAPRIEWLDAVLCFNHLLAVGSFEEAQHVGTIIKKSFQDGSIRRAENAVARPIEAFACWLFDTWTTKAPAAGEQTQRTFGAYAKIVHSWHQSPQVLVASMIDACDYHVKRSADPDDQGYPEFLEYLYSAFPVEIIAVQRVRESLGLATLPVDHAIMRTPLATPPAQIPLHQDEMLSGILMATRKRWPEF